MTHLSDELLSAHIDGDDLWSPDAAHLDECGECRTRLEALRGVVETVATPITPPAGHVREAAVAAAMVETTGVVPNMRRLVTRRERAVQSHVARRMSAASAAAALLVALGVGGWAISQVGKNSPDSSRVGRNAVGALKDDAFQTESATAGGAASTKDAAPFAGGASGSSEANSLAGFYDAGHIGTFSDTEPIAAKYREWTAKPEDERFSDGDVMVTPPCPNPPEQATVWHATLTYEGVAAWARVVTASSSVQTLQVLRQTDCELLASQVL